MTLPSRSITKTLLDYLENKNFQGNIKKELENDYCRPFLKSLQAFLEGFQEENLIKYRIHIPSIYTYGCETQALDIPFHTTILQLLGEKEREKKESIYPGYRDHYLHLVFVFLLGCYIVDSCPKLQQDFEKEIAHQISDNKIWYHFLRRWFFTSMAHDIGYIFIAKDPIQTEEYLREMDMLLQSKNDIGVEIWQQLLFRIGGTSQNQNFFQQYTKRCWPDTAERKLPPEKITLFYGEESFSDLICPQKLHNWGISKELSKWYYVNNQVDHGILGASFLWRLAKARDLLSKTIREEKKESEDVRPSLFRDSDFPSALSAIAIHNLRPGKFGSDDRLNYQNCDKLPFLLILCDGLQCFARCYFGETPEKRKKPLPPTMFNLEPNNNGKLIFQWDKNSPSKDEYPSFFWNQIVVDDLCCILKESDVRQFIEPM